MRDAARAEASEAAAMTKPAVTTKLPVPQPAVLVVMDEMTGRTLADEEGRAAVDDLFSGAAEPGRYSFAVVMGHSRQEKGNQ
jgi:hypothetical protein